MPLAARRWPPFAAAPVVHGCELLHAAACCCMLLLLHGAAIVPPAPPVPLAAGCCALHGATPLAASLPVAQQPKGQEDKLRAGVRARVPCARACVRACLAAQAPLRSRGMAALAALRCQLPAGSSTALVETASPPPSASPQLNVPRPLPPPRRRALAAAAAQDSLLKSEAMADMTLEWEENLRGAVPFMPFFRPYHGVFIYSTKKPSASAKKSE